MPENNIAKTYVRPDNTAVLTCTHCGIQKVVKADTFKGYKHKLKVKCSCKETFLVYLEFRNRIRKKVRLRGTYINHSQDNSSGDLIVLDISVTGLAFTSVDIKKFNVGDELTVDFALDDEHQSEYSKEVIVRDIREMTIGCEYETSEDAFGSSLGHYIMK